MRLAIDICAASGSPITLLPEARRCRSCPGGEAVVGVAPELVTEAVFVISSGGFVKSVYEAHPG